MPKPLDPAPRSYVPSVWLMRRSALGPAAAPEKTSPDGIQDWLLGEALDSDDLLTLFESFVWRLVAAGYPLARASLHVGTLHPQLIGFAWNWSKADGLCDEVKVAEAALRSDSYRRNPLFQVIEHGQSVHADTSDEAVRDRYPLIGELAAQGITEYLAVPLRTGGDYHNAATIATAREGGFERGQVDALMELLRFFSLHVERHMAMRLAGNVLETYLGAAAGERVLKGSIQRGSGQRMRAVIWASDMRGFTDLSDRLKGDDMLALLNAYFEALAGAIHDHGGDVLKFIGDGLLAVFPFEAFESEAAAAEAALAAARQALASLDRLNADPPEDLAAIEGWRPVASGIALHEGEVFFGNVGAPERLDFTVIGRSVNATARVEALSKQLGRPLLITEPVAKRLSAPLDHLGAHGLRGLSEPVGLFSPA